MGEAKQKSRNNKQILLENPRCIYCALPANTVEHMPPKAMFKDRFRLSGMEFGCCEACNGGTKGADAIASFLALLSPTDDPHNEWQLPVILRLLDTSERLAPGFKAELLKQQTTEKGFRANQSGFLEPVTKIVANGPIIKRNMTAFSAKLAMALFREHVGKPLTEGSGVFVRWFLNAGLSEKQALHYLRILPISSELRMGRQTSIKQFRYYYNCDEKSLIMAMIGFHSNLHILVAATSDMHTYGETFSKYKEMIFVEFGGLLKILADE